MSKNQGCSNEPDFVCFGFFYVVLNTILAYIHNRSFTLTIIERKLMVNTDKSI